MTLLINHAYVEQQMRGPRLHTFPEGRICEDCDTVLSIYNPGRLCALHAKEGTSK